MMNKEKEKELEARIEKLERNKWNRTVMEGAIAICVIVLTFLASCGYIAEI